MNIRKALPEDLAAIIRLEEQAFTARERWSAESWREELGKGRYTIVGVEDEVVATASLRLMGDIADLNRIIVAPRRRGRRLADELVRTGLDWARNAGARKTMLEVRADNAAAIGLYERHEFSVLTRRRSYYGPGADALIMEVYHV